MYSQEPIFTCKAFHCEEDTSNVDAKRALLRTEAQSRTRLDHHKVEETFLGGVLMLLLQGLTHHFDILSDLSPLRAFESLSDDVLDFLDDCLPGTSDSDSTFGGLERDALADLESAVSIDFGRLCAPRGARSRAAGYRSRRVLR